MSGRGKGKAKGTKSKTRSSRAGHPPSSSQRQLWWAHRRRRSSVLGSCTRVFERRDPRVGGQRCSWQQKDKNHPPSSSAGCAQWRGVEQIALRCHHRTRRCSAQYPGCTSPQEDWEEAKSLNSFELQDKNGSFRNHQMLKSHDQQISMKPETTQNETTLNPCFFQIRKISLMTFRKMNFEVNASCINRPHRIKLNAHVFLTIFYISHEVKRFEIIRNWTRKACLANVCLLL